MKTKSPILKAALAFALTIGTALPTFAAPMIAPSTPSPVASSDVIQVQSRNERRYNQHNDRNRFERRGNRAYYNGHPGYRYHRRGYRQYNGYWFPPGAFIAGAIIGGAIAQPPRAGNRHVQWCYDRWRSYRAYDNSYQPNYGPRRVCVSPYG